MLIGLMGAPGTGKGAHAAHLAAVHREAGRTSQVLHAPAGACPFDLATPAGQTWMHHQRTMAEDVEQVVFDVVVCEGTLVDYAAYVDNYGMTMLFQDIFNHCLARMLSYDLVYFHRAPDPALSTDQIRIDKTLENWVAWYPEYFRGVIEVQHGADVSG